MSSPQPTPLAYDTPGAVARPGPPWAAICGVPAVVFGATVLVATWAEDHHRVAWHGATIPLLWTSLIGGVGLTVAAVVTGLASVRRRRPWARTGLRAGVVGAVELALWLAMIAGAFRP